MAQVYERRHAYEAGAIVAIVTEEAPERFALALRIVGADGCEETLTVGSPTRYGTLAEAHLHDEDRYTNLRDAQDAVDQHVRRLEHDECSAKCAQWPAYASL